MPTKLQVIFEVVGKNLKEIDKARAGIRKFGKAAKGAFDKLATLRNALAVGIIIGVGKSFITAAAKMEVFSKQLLAISDSADQAKSSLAAISEFARTSPLETEDVVQAFVRLRAVGMEPVAEQLKTIGGVATLFGRKMSDVATSLIGLEKEVLVRLGVVIDRSGQKAVITSGKIRKVVEKDMGLMREAIVETWQERFPGAMELATDTFTAQMAILRSNIFVFQEKLGSEFLPQVKAIAKAFSSFVENGTENIRSFKVGILSFIAVFRTAFNAIQIIIDWNITLIMLYGQTWIAVYKSMGDSVRVFLKTLRNMGKFIKDALTGKVTNFKDVIFAGMDEEFARIKENFAGVQNTVEVFTESTEKNMGDIKNAWKGVVDASKETSDGVKKNMDFGGTGKLGGGEGLEIKDKEAESAAKKAAKEAAMRAKQVFDARAVLADVEVSLIRNTGDRKLAEMDLQHKRELAQLQGNQEAIAIIRKAHVLEVAEAEKQVALERFRSGVEIGNRAVDAAGAVANAVVSINKDKKDRMKPLLRANAVARGALSTVTAIDAAWETAGGNYYLGAALTAAAVIQNTALVAAQVAAINTAQHGTINSPGGTTLVGEQGPELTRFPSGAQVFTAGQTQRMVQNSTSNNNSVGNVTFNVSDAVTGDKMIKMMRNGQLRDFVVALNGQLATV